MAQNLLIWIRNTEKNNLQRFTRVKQQCPISFRSTLLDRSFFLPRVRRGPSLCPRACAGGFGRWPGPSQSRRWRGRRPSQRSRTPSRQRPCMSYKVIQYNATSVLDSYLPGIHLIRLDPAFKADLGTDPDPFRIHSETRDFATKN
jgi:hypothetical protein